LTNAWCSIFGIIPRWPRFIKTARTFVGLPEPQDSKEKASKVGKAAGEGAAAFLGKCSELVTEHFATVANPNIRKSGPVEKLKDIEEAWSISIPVWPTGAIKSQRRKVGVSFLGLATREPEIVPWIWRWQVDDVGHPFVSYLTALGKSKGTWGEVDGLPEGAIALGRIPISLPNDGFDMDAEPILAAVKTAIEQINDDDLKV
jgi:hypothetical protein